MEERAPRIRVLRPTKVEIDGVTFDAVIKNISFGGVLLLSDQRPETGSEVVLHDHELGRVEGEVVRTTDSGFAIFLGKSSDAATFALRSISADMMDTG